MGPRMAGRRKAEEGSRLKSVPREKRITKVIVITFVLAGIGLVSVFLTAFLDNPDRGARLFDAMLYSVTFDRCYSVTARFKQREVTIYFTNESLSESDLSLNASGIAPRGGFMTFTLDEDVRDPKRIRLLDLEHKRWLHLNIADSECPK